MLGEPNQWMLLGALGTTKVFSGGVEGSLTVVKAHRSWGFSKLEDVTDFDFTMLVKLPYNSDFFRPAPFLANYKTPQMGGLIYTEYANALGVLFKDSKVDIAGQLARIRPAPILPTTTS